MVELEEKRDDLVLVPWQSDFFNDPTRCRVAVCGRRSGKTTVAKAIIYTEALAHSNWHIWYVAPTSQMAQELMFEALLEMFPPSVVTYINRNKMKLVLTNGTTIFCKSSDNPDSLLGRGIHLLVLDEYQSQKDTVWYKIRPALSDYKGKVIIIGTPRGYDHFYDLWFRGSDENPEKMSSWNSYQITTIEAGTIDIEEIEDARNDMSAKQFAQEYLASFNSLSGVVYDSFTPNTNITDRITLAPQLESDQIPTFALRIGMDFNISPMTAVIGIVAPADISISGYKEMWICEEVYLEDSNTREMIEVLHGRFGTPKDKQNPFHNRIKQVYPDPSGGSRRTEAAKNSTNHSLLQDAGFPLIGHDTSAPLIIDSVNEVNALFCNANGISRLYIHPRCVHLIKTIKGLTYVNNEPDKKSGLDHMSDCLRYLVHNTFPLNKQQTIRKRGLI
jgi:hypothetical protein